MNETKFKLTDDEKEYTQPSEGETASKETKFEKFQNEAKAAGFYLNNRGYVDLTKTDISLVFNDKLTDEQLIRRRAIFNKTFKLSVTNAGRQPEKIKEYIIEKLTQKEIEVTKFMRERGLESTSQEEVNIFDY